MLSFGHFSVTGGQVKELQVMHRNFNHYFFYRELDRLQRKYECTPSFILVKTTFAKQTVKTY